MSLLSSLVLLGTLLVLHAASEDVEKKAAVVNDEFEVDYETAASLAGLAIECHDQVLMFLNSSWYGNWLCERAGPWLREFQLLPFRCRNGRTSTARRTRARRTCRRRGRSTPSSTAASTGTRPSTATGSWPRPLTGMFRRYSHCNSISRSNSS